MFQKVITIFIFLTSLNAVGSQDWCIWDGEEYIKDNMQLSGKHWLQAVYELHSVDSSDVDSSSTFEGVGSCRFIDRSLGEKPLDVINNYVASFSYIIATRAYLRTGSANEIIIPEAFYSAGSNWVYVAKNFYSIDRPLCEKQKAQMVELAQQSQGIRFTDVEYKKNKFGGVSAVINGASPSTNYLGVCHFN